MKCSDIGFGTYDCAYNIMPPWRQDDGQVRYIAVDKCLIYEVISLWEHGIRTTGCCCGHDKLAPFISVVESDIPKMKELGYKVQINPYNPGSEDHFYPKTVVVYGDADHGFNWWDNDHIADTGEMV